MVLIPQWAAIAQERWGYREQMLSMVSPPVEVPPVEDLPRNAFKVSHSVLTPEEIKITESDPAVLLKQLAKGSLTAVEVTNAFLRRAVVAQRVANCITEVMPRAALERAKYLDEEFKKTGKTVGPLHGLPISVKEHVGMKGLDLNTAYCAWVGRTAEEDSDILKPLWAAGCVFYARTTQPQSLMHLETSSNLYGTTVNPFNRNLTSGGSSGGEGALVGMRGSCLGIGTDIGGSIRSPAGNNGVYGLRPTAGRLPMEGLLSEHIGEHAIASVVGPLSTSLSGVSIFMKTILDSKPWITDPSLVPIPWRGDEVFLPAGKKIKIGVMKFDGVVMPHPPITAAIDKVVSKLEQFPDLFEMVEWNGLDHVKAWDIISPLYYTDGGKRDLEAMARTNEPILPLTKFIMTENPNVNPEGLTQHELWDLQAQRDSYKKEYAAAWNEKGLDLILCPVGPQAAPRLLTARWWGYTSLWNLLDYPALVFPVSKVEGTEGNWGYEPVNERDKYNYDLWDAEYYKDAPVNLQLVGRGFDDEKVVEALALIQEKIGLPFVDHTK